jgi:ribosomal-protein-alanine N-acetyltransferase
MFPVVFLTARLALRPIAPEDAGPILATYAQDREVTRFLTWRPHRNRGETEAYIAQCLAKPPNVARTYVLVDQQNHSLRGALHLRRGDGPHLEVGYVLARTCWGQGLMTEALTEVVAQTLTRPSVLRIGAVCDVDNIASARVMEKAGLAREGLLRRWHIHPNISDEPRDCFSYARAR